MPFFTTIRLVLRTLAARKGRSLLTILGIMIGVAGVIMIISLGEGAQSLVLGQVTKVGTDLLSVQPGKSDETGPPAQVFGIVVTTLTADDAEALRDKGRVPYAMAVSAAVLGTASVSWRDRTIDTNFIGTEHEYPKVINLPMEKGRFFDAQEGGGNANVVVLGAGVAQDLFADSGVDPVGQVVKVKSASRVEPGGIPLRVIGVVAKRGSLFFQDQDDFVFLPLTIGQQQLLGIRHLQEIDIKVAGSPYVSSTIQDVKDVLWQRHRIRDASEVDFTVRNIADAVKILTTITDALALFLTAMAAIALVVGGIGILNIMLVTVAERTREIGLRKAVGATPGAIRNQFLLEAATLTLCGGLIGIVFGVTISFLISLLMRALGFDWAFVVSFASIALAVGVSVLTGIVFGTYPALKAAKLDPIEALRYE